jgi:hypothetical protein
MEPKAETPTCLNCGGTEWTLTETFRERTIEYKLVDGVFVTTQAGPPDSDCWYFCSGCGKGENSDEYLERYSEEERDLLRDALNEVPTDRHRE